MREKYDVIIVGSGPSGASAARALRGSGLRTAILERKKLPRHKMCSRDPSTVCSQIHIGTFWQGARECPFATRPCQGS